MTIGRPQGAVWIGKPLDVAVPLSLDSGDDESSLCLEAELLQGDAATPDRRLAVSIDPASGGSATVRLRSNAAVEEPVITLNVRAGCSLKASRSYVLLADVPSDVALPSVAGAPIRLPGSDASVPAARAAARAAARSAGGGGSSSGSAARPAARRSTAPPADLQATNNADAPPAAPRRPRPAPEAAARRPAVVNAAAIPRATTPAATAAAAAAPADPVRDANAGRPRLQLEALDPAAATVGSLKASPELKLPDAPDPARRAAAAALWNALDPSAAQAQQEAQRTKELESTLAVLREQAAQNQRTLLEMRSELAEARESRYSNPLVYALLLLLLLALIGLFMLWRLARRATAPAWWGEAPTPAAAAETKRGRTVRGLLDDEMDLGPDGDDDPPARRGDPPRMFVPTPFAPLEARDAEPDSGMGEPIVLPPMHHADGTPIRQVNTEELFDVQQQSDFFLSLGQKDQAITVLREHIADNPGTSALAYLDLLRIYHSMDRKEDYAQLAEDFERVFNADVPDFEHFAETGRGLEYYRGALSRIEAQWPAPGTLALIEELVFRKPGGGHDEGGFDLAAYQELLLLYSVAKEVIEPDGSAPPIPVAHDGFADTISREWPATATAPVEAETAPPPLTGGPVLPPSLYGSIDHGLEEETVLSLEAPTPMLPTTPTPLAEPAPQTEPEGETELDLARFDRTAYETMPTPIEAAKPEPASDPHLIDFDLFDPATEAEIAPRTIKR